MKLKQDKSQKEYDVTLILLVILAVWLLFIVLNTTLRFQDASASNTTNAAYVGTVRISNNGTATSNVLVPFTCKTSWLIDDHLMNSSANDTAMLTHTGADVAYMPAASGNNTWMVYVPSIPANSSVDYKLYLGGGDDMSGKLRYIPDIGGMTTTDNASLELGDNFTIEQKVWVDTASISDNLVYKPAAFETYVSATGNITSRFTVLGDALQYSHDAEEYTESQTYIKLKEITLTKSARQVRIKFDIKTTHATYAALGRVYKNDVALGTEQTTASTTYVTKTEDLTANAEIGDKIQLYGKGSGSQGCYVQNFRIYYDEIQAIATSVSSGEHTIATSANTTHISISVDGQVQDTTSLGANVTDNSENWTFTQSFNMMYLEYHKITINGTLQQHIIWENDASTFTDQSGNGHDATPTFRTTSTDADVSADLVEFEPVSPSKASDWSLSEAGTMITEAPTQPSDFYQELTYGNDPPMVGAINSMIDATNAIPRAYIWFPLATFMICIIGLLIGHMSLLAQTITMAVLFFFAAGWIWSPWLGIIFIIDSAALMVGAKMGGY